MANVKNNEMETTHNRKKLVLILIFIVIMLLFSLIVCFFIHPKMESEKSTYGVKVNELFSNKEHYYVYFYKDDCRYCKNIESAVNDFSKTHKLKKVNVESCVGLKDFDWESFEKDNDVKIGYENGSGDIIYNQNMNASQVEKKYPPLLYKIVLINQDYATLHKGKKAGEVYAVSTHPQLQFRKNNFVVPGVPMLIEFNKGKVVNYYFDDKEIINFLHVNIKPLDNYWNLE
ncbi:hypothetical protein ACTQ1O_05945 [Bilifractor sp. LCP21S3_A7]|uniref:hypothetical protein n=1 Tax=Bilifractor sp. LCP21S3_A7 TaxID=3438738 RepID=UPI003F8E2096